MTLPNVHSTIDEKASPVVAETGTSAETTDAFRSGGEFHHVHKLTPLLRAWSVLFALIIFAATTASNQFIKFVRMLFSTSLVETLQALGGLALGALLAFLISLLWWRVSGYRITRNNIAFRRGLLRTKIRTARLDRIQGVDVIQPWHARLFGLAAVRIETAGGGDSRIEVGFIRRDEANQLRARLLGETEEGKQLVAPIPITRSLAAAFFSFPTVFTIASTTLTLSLELTWASVLPVLFATIPNIWRILDGSYQFTARRIDNKITVTYGLANLQRKAVPVERVHATEMYQPPLWRPFGWWRVRVSVAGYGEGSKGAVLLPVGTYDTAVRLVEEVGLAFETLEPRAVNPDYSSPRRARIVSPFDAHNQGFTLTDTLAVEHRGWLTRRVSIVFRKNIQELSVRWGPLQQLVKLSSVQLHLVTGPVRMAGRDLSAQDTKELVGRLAPRMLQGCWDEPVDSSNEDQASAVED